MNYNKIALDKSNSICIYSIKNRFNVGGENLIEIYRIPQIKLLDNKVINLLEPDPAYINFFELADIKSSTEFRTPFLCQRLSYNFFHKRDNSDIEFEFGNIVNYDYDGLIKFSNNTIDAKKFLLNVFIIKKCIIDIEIQYIEKKPDIFLVCINIQMTKKKTSDKIYFEMTLGNERDSLSSSILSDFIINTIKRRCITT